MFKKEASVLCTESNNRADKAGYYLPCQAEVLHILGGLYTFSWTH